MVEKIGKQENLPENMGIIPILKMKEVILKLSHQSAEIRLRTLLIKILILIT